MSDSTVATEGGPFSEQREIYELLSQQTRHLVLQYILAHPRHLLSLDEFAYLIPKNKAAIRDQVQRLQQEGIIDRYDYPPNEDARDLPWQFYGLTEYGVDILEEYNYLRGLPVARALYDHTRLSEKAERHRDAPRPELPESVARALRIEGGAASGELEQLVRYVRERNEHTHSLDDQVALMEALYRNDVGPDHEGLSLNDIRELDLDLQHQSKTVSEHLVDIGVAERVEPTGPDVLAISERSDEIVNGRVDAEAERNLEALVRDLDDELGTVQLDRDAAEWSQQDAVVTEPSVALADGAGRPIRAVLAEAFDVAPDRVAEFLQSGDPIERLNAAVEAIESSDEVTRANEYGRILFVNRANRYRLSQQAIDRLGAAN